MWLEIFLFVVVTLLVRWWWQRPSNLAPGPWVIPYLGSKQLLSVDDVRAGWKKYGDIFKTEVMQKSMVFICNYRLIKEAYNKKDFSDRPDIEFNNRMSDGKVGGVIMTNGQHWVNARRFLLRNLRDLGMGRTYLEDAIQKEAQMLVSEFKAQAGTASAIPKSLEIAVLNVVWQMVASLRYDPKDAEAFAIINILRSFEASKLFMLFEFVPFLKKIVPKFIRRTFLPEDEMDQLIVESKKLCKNLIESHRANLDPSNPRDVMDEYLLAMDKKEDIAEYFSEMDLMRNIFDLFQAGFDTVSTTLRWLILYVAKYPEVQRRVQQQIDDVVPRDTLPSFEHKSRLPLVEALYTEVLRHSSMIATGVVHENNTDTILDGYLIPKGSMVFACAVCCHEDPRYWEQPHQFRLDRFLDQEGKFLAQKDGFLAFGIGRRVCLGESLARMELYLFTAALLQNFSFAAPDGVDLDLKQDPRIPTARMAKVQNVVITARE